MEKTKVLIVEDEPIIAADLQKQLLNLGYDVLETCDNGEDAIRLTDQYHPDIILMDVQLDGHLDGIDTAHHISKNHNIPIIYLTGNTDNRTFARAKLTNPAAFLSKPFRTKDLQHSIGLATSHTTQTVSEMDTKSIESILGDRIFIRNKSALHKVMIEDILLIEAEGSYCKIVTDQKDYTISSTLKKFLSSIKANHLIRVHRSYVINLSKVDQISEGSIYIGEHIIPVGRAYREEIIQYFKSF